MREILLRLPARPLRRLRAVCRSWRSLLSDDHKALRIHSSYSSQQLCYVLTLGDGGGHEQRWRESQAAPAHANQLSCTNAVVDGIAYFLITRPRYVDADEFEGPVDGIASFDLATEQWSPALLHGPWSGGGANETLTSIHRNNEWLRLAALNGCLVMVHDKSDCHTMDPWFHAPGRSSESGQSLWCRRFAIPYGSMYRLMEPLWELDDGRLAIWMGGGLKMYDPRTPVQDVPGKNRFHLFCLYFT
ncbi:hypothetical protein BS78_02G068700 [Paspalum vaginatum]|nr:hypothetical protein BS78_02G068700 [Paspalum vaginatum]